MCIVGNYFHNLRITTYYSTLPMELNGFHCDKSLTYLQFCCDPLYLTVQFQAISLFLDYTVLFSMPPALKMFRFYANNSHKYQEVC